MAQKQESMRVRAQAAEDRLKNLQINFDQMNNQSHELRLRYEGMRAGLSDEQIEQQVKDIIK